MKNNKKLVALVCCMLMLVGAAGATLAWLTNQTQTVTNTFAPSDIKIELTETDAVDTDEDGLVDTKNDFKMVPGDTLTKDPKVTVKAGSEACWLFVEVTKENNFDHYMTYSMGDGWIKLGDEYPGVYYRTIGVVGKVLSEDTDPMPVLKDNAVYVIDKVTKADMEALMAEDAELPKLTVKAYAVQKANVGVDTNKSELENAIIAWKEAK